MAVTGDRRRRPAGRFFIGREWQLDELRGGLTSAREGRGRLFLVSGEAGIGKTRLVGELAELAESTGVRVLWGRCWEGEEAPAFWPWTQIFRNLVRRTEPGRTGQAPAELAQLIPDLKGLVGDPSDLSSRPPMNQARFRLFDATATSLRAVALEKPLVLILEDLHEADRSSLMLLEFVARQIHDMPLLMLATFREPEADLNAAVRTTLGRVIRSGNRVPLAGLEQQEVAEFLVQGFEVFLPDEVLSKIRDKTGGNPFFLDELGRDLAAQSSGPPSNALHVPEGLRVPIRSRLFSLPPDDRALLTIASVIGREFAPDLLVAVSGRPKDSILAALGRLAARHLVDLAGFGLGPYRFAHALVRETIYEDLPAEERWRLHRRVGEALEKLYSSELDRHLEQLAQHFLHAAPLGEVDRAIQYSQQAAQRAASQVGYEEAVGHYARAVGLAKAGDRPAGERFDLLLAKGDAEWWAGHVDDAGRTFQSAASLAREMSDSSRLARAALRVGEVGHGGVYMQAWDYDPLRVKLLEEALGALGDEPSELRARVLARLSTALYFSPFNSSTRREKLSRVAIDLARRIGDESTLAYALNARHLAVWGPENIDERLALATEITALGASIGDLSLQLTGRVWRLADLLETGAVREADFEIEAYEAVAERAGYPHFVAYAFMFRAVQSILRGQFYEAESFALRSAELGTRVSDVNLQLSHHVQMAVLRALQGRPEETAGHLGLASGGVPAEVDRIHVSLMCLAGDESGAADALLSTSRGRDRVPPAFWIPMNAGLAVLASGAGAADEAKAIYEALLPYERRWVLSGRDVVAPLGPVAYYLGLLAALLARFEAAAGHFELALSSAQAIGARPYAALIQAAYGAMLAARGNEIDQARASALLTDASKAAGELGMRQVQQQVNAALGAPRSPAASAPTGVLRKDGELWTVGFGGDTVLMKDAKGLHLLKRLLAVPGSELHVLDLAAGSVAHSQTSPENDLPEGWSLEGVSAQTVLDPAAKAAYRARIEELNLEIQEAEDHHDLERASAGRAEMQFILDELASAIGFSGRDRKVPSPAERARSSVSKSIRSSIRRIQAVHPALGAHLATAVRTGYFCSYRPHEPVDWET
jgi:tetratricopeptide (TPR) repeat protein